MNFLDIVPHPLLPARWLCLALTFATACSGSPADNASTSEAQAGKLCPSGSAAQDECPSEAERPSASALIDDLEDGNGSIPMTDGRNGSWWTAGDDTAGATMVPIADQIATPETIEGGRCDSKRAMHVTGQGYLDWGSLLGMDLLYGTRTDGTSGDLPYDASAYTGVEFWARIGDTSTDRVRFAVSDVNNEPYGGVCTDNDEVNVQCYDAFSSYLVGLGPDWRHYRIAFASLTQRHFGFPASAAATNALFTVQFNFEPGAIFDFWVDDVA
ncbi:MAG TPA: hypothetical protein VEQ58_14780, partial [Polyangiaceae bacterium]|nr:hypothetical protein [Polyangiaceae bacterium]